MTLAMSMIWQTISNLQGGVEVGWLSARCAQAQALREVQQLLSCRMAHFGAGPVPSTAPLSHLRGGRVHAELVALLGQCIARARRQPASPVHVLEGKVGMALRDAMVGSPGPQGA
eukprot:CAMPEP_0182863206 /NCGR_PEP_ID=MMETSP0034_2-20130328/6508_1 /TAXON_ID=156128 /ORGANISM="Nephroselmis pyriformis, Strain CCMP717" /LENGTH=114 /DNA_ID=CAMNT_0024995379 /DNA_START=43 /DNA_END=385 /DNA_ORIENTATION=+